MKYEKGDRFTITVERVYGTEPPLYCMVGAGGKATTVVMEAFLDDCERLPLMRTCWGPKHRGELLAAAEETLTPEELERLARIKEQPPEVVDAAFARLEELRKGLMELDRRYDDLIDWLNGEDPEEIARRSRDVPDGL